MVPVRLAIEGLYSYQQRQEVNFRPLVESGLFGIFGQVGSGKTSLLEAISFVLYGEVERLNKTNNRAYNMMNLKTGRMRIEFEFRAGADQHEYRYTYEAKRNKKQHHDIHTGERKVDCRTDGLTWVPQSLEDRSVGQFTESVLGLDYDNFKRTVIIPQNQFREFLELSPADRTEMMMQLFNLKKFDLLDPTTALDKANQTELDTLTGQLSGLDEATLDAVEAADIAAADLRKQIDEQGDRLLVLETEQTRLTRLHDRHAQLADARAEFDRLTTEKPRYDQLEADLNRYEQADRVFRPLLSQLGQVTDKQGKLAKQVRDATKRLTDLRHELPGLRQRFDTALLSFRNRHQLQSRIEEYSVVKLIWHNQHEIDTQRPILGTIQTRARQQAERIDQRRAERTQLQTEADRLSRQADRLDELRAAERWFEQDSAWRDAIEKIESKIVANEAASEAIKRRKDEALHGFDGAWANRELKLKDLPPLIEADIDALKIEQERRKTDHDENLLRQRLQQFANALTDGKPCPLCGAVHHPAVHRDGAIDEAVRQSGLVLAQTTARLTALTALLSEIRELRVELTTVVGQRKDLQHDQHQAVTDRTDHEARFVWPDFSPTDRPALTAAMARQTADQKRLADVQKKINALTTDLDRLGTEQARTANEATAMATGLAGLERSIRTDMGQLQEIKPAEVAMFSLSQIDGLMQDLHTQFAGTETAHNKASRELTTAETKLGGYEAELAQLTARQTELGQEHDTLSRDLTEALTQHGLTRPAVETLLLKKLDTIGGRQQSRLFAEKLAIARTRTDDLTTDLAHQPFDPAELAQVRTDCTAARTAQHTAHQELGERNQTCARLRDQWTLKQTLTHRQNELTLRRADLKDLKDLFRGNGFAKYVSSVRLKELCHTANERFSRLTNNQLRLEFVDDNFIVRDFMNGGKTRLAKTLSGGQMFQAALSLALALSDNIRHLTNATQHLFFLDEGFGTLDKAALQTVFETLKSLRRENRIVGIISHVEELQQEIDTYIRTVSTDNGSRIDCSWESEP
jgi:DNA repair protein SbcC/Rad50